ncbi:hypothetical protein POM88_016124 [Heracleum sosnowskyi]|uniref:Uncharacterized protein n=1 Tax=Heracleum sosnowskyi TaxID=360622 RepID=A0AAD8MWK3_9APIA|nr:hypothetical protein POM88_016124 [Heracleum sosnowskyi]
MVKASSSPLEISPEITKIKKKKGRPSFADLQKRNQSKQDQKYLSLSSSPNSNRRSRRMLRRSSETTTMTNVRRNKKQIISHQTLFHHISDTFPKLHIHLRKTSPELHRMELPVPITSVAVQNVETVGLAGGASATPIPTPSGMNLVKSSLHEVAVSIPLTYS